MEDARPDFEALNNELLEEEVEDTVQEPKRNSKQALIEKILQLSEEGVPLELSNTKLKRMNKKQLANQLASMIEERIKMKMAHSVGADSTDNRTLALGALRMCHDLLANVSEQGANVFLEPRGYTVKGFCEELKKPNVSEAIDSCLEEIAAENEELLQYVQSPWSRLAIAWGGAMAFSARKCKALDASHVGSRPFIVQNPRRARRGRGPQNGQEHPDIPPPETHAKTV